MFLGGYLSLYIPPAFAKGCFAAVLLVGAWYMSSPPRRLTESHSEPKHWWIWHRTGVSQPYTINILALVPVMLAAGFVAGMLGVGGGLIKVPAVVVLGGVPMTIAICSSSLMIGVTALTGFLGHLLRGHFNWLLTAVLAGRSADRFPDWPAIRRQDRPRQTKKVLRPFVGRDRHLAGLRDGSLTQESVAHFLAPVCVEFGEGDSIRG